MKKKDEKYDIFISYRRDNGWDTAKHLRDILTAKGYSVFFDFAGLKPGTTQVTVRSESPLAGNEEYQYTATVDENLNVELEPTEEDQQLSE